MSEDFISPSVDKAAYYRKMAYNKRHGIPCLRTCLICGKQFEINNARRRYCSDACVEEAARRHVVDLRVPVKTKVCQICGQEFKTNFVTKMYCSKKCSNLAECAKKKERRHSGMSVQHRCEPVDRVCKFCGKTFTTDNPRKVFCCGRCAILFAKWKCDIHQCEARKLANLQRVCKFCGQTFMAEKSHKNQRFCSKKCRLDAAYYGSAEKRARRIEERHENKEAKSQSFGLTAEQRKAVIDAQDGDPSLLWSRSQTWTPAQRRFAKKRYEEMNGLWMNQFRG